MGPSVKLPAAPAASWALHQRAHHETFHVKRNKMVETSARVCIDGIAARGVQHVAQLKKKKRKINNSNYFAI